MWTVWTVDTYQRTRQFWRTTLFHLAMAAAHVTATYPDAKVMLRLTFSIVC